MLPRGCGVRGLLYYLFTEGLAGAKGLESDHSDARVIASWDGRPDAVQPGLGVSGKRDFTELAALGYSTQELRTINRSITWLSPRRRTPRPVRRWTGP